MYTRADESRLNSQAAKLDGLAAKIKADAEKVLAEANALNGSWEGDASEEMKVSVRKWYDEAIALEGSIKKRADSIRFYTAAKSAELAAKERAAKAAAAASAAATGVAVDTLVDAAKTAINAIAHLGGK